MGTCMAQSYANLFMVKFERAFMWTQTVLPHVWWRFIDDVFAILTHGEQRLQMFLGELNHRQTSIKFIANWSTEEDLFLDTQVYIKNGRVGTDLYTKPTNKKNSTCTRKAATLNIARQLPYNRLFS